jgi:cell wall-associated NlpC family hydrolase
MPRGGRLTAFVVATAVLVVAARPASADEVANLRQRANQIVQQQAALQEQASLLTDQLNGARLELEQTRSQVSAVQARLDDQRSSLVGLNAQLTQFAVKSYVYGDSQAGLGTLFSGEVPGKDVAARQGYTDVFFGENRDIVDEVKAKRIETAKERALLDTALARQQNLLTTIERYRTQVEDNQQKLVSLLSQVQGDLATAVAEAEARRLAEEERKAREAAARQAAELERQRQEQLRRSTTTTNPNNLVIPRPSAPRTELGAPSTPSTTRPGGTTPATTRPSAPSTIPATTRPTTPPTTRPPVVDYPAPNPGAARAVQAALAQVGKPYKYASADPAVGFDCSGLTSFAWAQSGVSLPHYSKAQWERLPKVPIDALQPGDLVFYYFPAVSHVGIYIGGGQMVDAQGPGYSVRIAPIFGRGLFAAGRPG